MTFTCHTVISKSIHIFLNMTIFLIEFNMVICFEKLKELI